ncbi:hypothetical protein Ancab_029111 [Ancistrocladus abbreviatus]
MRENNNNENISNNNIINGGGSWCPSSLKINKDSHTIKKSSSSSSPSPSSSLSSSSSSSTMMSIKPQQRHPVIIYTHSPKIIHTNPRDFMALVQRLTGFSPPPPPLSEGRSCHDKVVGVEDDLNSIKCNGNPKDGGGGEDNESSSVITDENCGTINSGSTTVGDDGGDGGQVNSSCLFEPSTSQNPSSFMQNVPLFISSSAELLCCSDPSYENNMDFRFSYNLN